MSDKITPTDVHVGARIQMARRLKNFSQEHIATKLGISFQQIQKYENGVNRVAAGRLHELSQILEVPISFFFDGAKHSGRKSNVDLSGSPDLVTNFFQRPGAVDLAEAYVAINENAHRSAVIDVAKALSSIVGRGIEEKKRRQ